MAPPMKKQITAIQEATFSCKRAADTVPAGASSGETGAECHQHSATKRKCPSQRQTVAKARAPHLRHPFVHEPTARQGRDGGAGNCGEDEGEFPIQLGRIALEVIELVRVLWRDCLAEHACDGGIE